MKFRRTSVLSAVICSCVFASLSASAQPYNARGSFNGWGEAPLVDNGDGTHSLLIGGTASEAVNFKIAMNGWDNSWPATDVRSYFNNAGEFTFHFAPGPFSDGWTPVANRVGYTDPEQFGWEIIGSYDNWAGGPQLVLQSNGLYSVDHVIASPGNYEFKFRRSGSWDVAIGADFGNNAGNATFTTAEPNQTLRFELDLPRGAWRVAGAQVEQPIKAAIQFEANMTVQIAAGNFDTNSHQVWARGSATGWGDPPAGLQLFEDIARPGIFTNTFRIETHLASSTIEYKFTVWDTGSLQTRWEDGDNRTITFTGSEPTDTDGYHLKSVSRYFNDQSAADILSQDTLVTFRVNMANAQDKDGTPFNPEIDDLYINGNFANWYGWGGMPSEYQVFDNGTAGGDATAGDLIYSYQRLFPRGSSTRLVYKYGIFSNDNEAPAFNDHVRYIRALGTYVLPIDTFGLMLQEPDFGELTITRNGSAIQLNWLGRPGVKLQKTSALSPAGWSDVPDTDGANSAQVTVPATAEYFRLLKP